MSIFYTGELERLVSKEQNELDEDDWDSLPDIWSNQVDKMPRSKKGNLKASTSLSDVLEDVKISVSPNKTNEQDKMSRDHWERGGGMRQKCNGCRRTITLVFKRHHCRMCGKIFCQNCSRFKRKLSTDATPNPDGDFHRVCLYCKEEDDDCDIGFAKSWTNDFMNMRLAAHARKFPLHKEPELKLLCEIPKVCLPITDLFLSDILKEKQTYVKTKLQNCVKAARRNSDCSDCGRPLIVPKDRKECVVCDDIYCSKHSTKNLVVYYPRGAVQKTDLDQGRVQPNMEVMTQPMDISTIADTWRNYRTCSACEKHLERELNVFQFNSRLQDGQRELMDLGQQILATLNRVLESKAYESNLDRSASMDNLNEQGDGRFDGFPRSQSDALTVLYSQCEAKMADQRVTQKLFDRYWTIYNVIRVQLKPVTHTQILLHKHVVSAACSFYSEKRWHFRVRYDSTVSSSSEEG